MRDPWTLWIAILAMSLGPNLLYSLLFALSPEVVLAGRPLRDYQHSAFWATLVISTLSFMLIEGWWMTTIFRELNAFRGYLYHPFLSACLPIFNFYAFYQYTEALETEFRLRRLPSAPEPVFYCCLLFVLHLGLPLFQYKLNELWRSIEVYGDSLTGRPPSAAGPNELQPPYT